MHAEHFAARHAAARPGPPVPMVQFLRFTVGSEAYVVRIEGVREILEVGRITPVPLMPGCVRGVMNLRGLVVPVVDLGVRLGLATTRLGKRTAVVVVHMPGADGSPQTLGMLVDTVQEVFKCREGDLEPAPRLGASIPAAFVRSMVHIGEQVAVELALDQLLGAQTLAALIAADAPEPPQQGAAGAVHDAVGIDTAASRTGAATV